MESKYNPWKHYLCFNALEKKKISMLEEKQVSKNLAIVQLPKYMYKKWTKVEEERKSVNLISKKYERFANSCLL